MWDWETWLDRSEPAEKEWGVRERGRCEGAPQLHFEQKKKKEKGKEVNKASKCLRTYSIVFISSKRKRQVLVKGITASLVQTLCPDQKAGIQIHCLPVVFGRSTQDRLLREVRALSLQCYSVLGLHTRPMNYSEGSGRRITWMHHCSYSIGQILASQGNLTGLWCV